MTQGAVKIQVVAAMIVMLGGDTLASSDAAAADKFVRLSGSQIRATFAGMQMTDEVHWRDVYERDGVLRTESMGRKTAGKWRIEKNELCLDTAPPDGGCFEAWISGKKVQLKPSGLGSPPEGSLEMPTDRN